jgi:rhodanese-related sulfurtransferase
VGEETTSSPLTYQTISVSELDSLVETNDIVLINVHIPLEGNIPGTDAEIPFNDIEAYLSALPTDKDEKIIVYCRSGSMGKTASQTLVELGYSDVSNLDGGYLAWIEYGLPFEELH